MFKKLLIKEDYISKMGLNLFDIPHFGLAPMRVSVLCNLNEHIPSMQPFMASIMSAVFWGVNFVEPDIGTGDNKASFEVELEDVWLSLKVDGGGFIVILGEESIEENLPFNPDGSNWPKVLELVGMLMKRYVKHPARELFRGMYSTTTHIFSQIIFSLLV